MALVDRWSFNRLGSSRSCCMSAAPETIRCEVLCAYVTSSLRSAWPVA